MSTSVKAQSIARRCGWQKCYDPNGRLSLRSMICSHGHDRLTDKTREANMIHVHFSFLLVNL